MASYYKTLEQALKDLSFPSDLALYIRVIARKPDVTTKEEIAKVIADEALSSLQATDEILEQLVQVVAKAKAGQESAAPAEKAFKLPVLVDPSAPVEEVVAAEPETEAEPETQAEVEPITPVVEEQPVAEPVAAEELSEALETPEIPEATAESAEGFDPQDFLKVRLIAANIEEIQDLETKDLGGGKIEFSWKPSATEGAIYVLAMDEEDFPSTVRNASDVAAPTQKTSIVVTTELRYFTLFEFAEAGATGMLIGRGRVLGDIKTFDCRRSSDRVSMSWVSNDPKAKVVLYKSKVNQKLPKFPSAEFRLKLDEATNSKIDINVDTGETFEYRVQLEWVSPSGKTLTSEGKSATLTIPGTIPSLKNFKVVHEAGNEYVDISYDELANENAEVTIFQVRGAAAGELLELQDPENAQFPIDRLDQENIQNALGQVVIAQKVTEDGVVRMNKVPLLANEGIITYSALVTLGNEARYCGWQPILLVEETKLLGLDDFYDYQLLRLEVPAGAIWLQVWVANLDTEFADLDHDNPQMTIDVENDYRKHGGILFAKPDGKSNRFRLERDPKRIFVRGISRFAGKENPGNPQSIYYPGRIEVGYRRKETNEKVDEPKKKGLFGFGGDKDDQAPAVQRGPEIEFQVRAPAAGFVPPVEGDSNSRYSMVPVNRVILTQVTSAIEEYPLGNIGERITGVELDFGSFSEWSTYSPQNQGAAPAPAGKNAPPANTLRWINGKRNRFIAMETGDHKTPIFVIDATTERLQANIPDFARAPERVLKIALVGAKTSGKTTYAQALLHYLEKQFASTFESFFSPVQGDAIAKARLEQMHKFVESGEVPAPTRAASAYDGEPVDERDPRAVVRYTLATGNSPVGIIEMVDIAGEDMDSVAELSRYQKSLREADLIVFLMDPLQVPQVANLVRGVMAVPNQGSHPMTIIENLIQVLGPIEGRNPNQKVAMTISKFDALRSAIDQRVGNFVGTLDGGMAITRDPNAFTRKTYNAADGLTVNAEVAAMLVNMQLTPIRLVVNDPTKFKEGSARFFVVSALGHGILGRAHGLSSFRISDPIRWALQTPAPQPPAQQ